MVELPMGFSFALAQNQEAMEYFSSLPESAQREIINQTHNIGSKRQMREFVAGLTQNQSYK